jgi:UDP:flavonoid glycosyltransferase YjiC (YdhE family)
MLQKSTMMPEPLNPGGPRRFLFSSSAGYGHIHPLVPLARALMRVGHKVAFATHPARQPMLQRLGFDFFPLTIDLWADPEYQQIRAELENLPVTLESEITRYARIWCGIAPRLRTPPLVETIRSWRPDMLVREGGEYAALIAAEHLDLPHATVAFTTALRGQAIFEQQAAEGLDPVRHQWGLPPDPDLTTLYRYLYLSYAPPTFSTHEVGVAGAAGDLPPTTRNMRPTIFDNARDEPLPEWIDALPPQPTVYVTLGTEVNQEPELYPAVLQTIIAGLRDMPLNLIVTLGRDKDPADFDPQPPNVHIARYIPQSLLLPRCDLIVFHGGTNSLLAALDTGLPMVIIPLIADQFFNARIAHSLQLAQILHRAQLSPSTIRAAVHEVLANPLYRQNVGNLQREMHALPGQDYAVRLVEEVARA